MRMVFHVCVVGDVKQLLLGRCYWTDVAAGVIEAGRKRKIYFTENENHFNSLDCEYPALYL